MANLTRPLMVPIFNTLPQHVPGFPHESTPSPYIKAPAGAVRAMVDDSVRRFVSEREVRLRLERTSIRPRSDHRGEKMRRRLAKRDRTAHAGSLYRNRSQGTVEARTALDYVITWEEAMNRTWAGAEAWRGRAVSVWIW